MLASIAALIISSTPVVNAALPAQDLKARQAAFKALLSKQWEYTLEQQPETASTIGDFRFNDRWSDPSPANVKAQYMAARGFLKKFQRVNPDGFSTQERISLKMIVQAQKDVIDGYKLKIWEMPFDPENGPQINVPNQIPSFDFSTVRHYDDYIKRLHGIPSYMHSAIACAKLGIRDHLTTLDIFVPKMIGQVREILKAKGAANPFISGILNFPAKFSPKEKARLRRELVAAVPKYVEPAYRELASFLSGPLAKAARHQPGWCNLPNGDQLYRYNLRSFTTTGLSPDAIHNLGLAEVKADVVAENKLAQSQGYDDRKAYLKALRADPNEYFHSAAEFLQRYRDDMRSIEKILPNYFKNLPTQPLDVYPVEKYREATSDGAEYQSGSPDGKRKGRIVVNPVSWKTSIAAFEDSTAYHEGEPGHHLQISAAMSLHSIPDFRRFAFYSAYQEGWALYCEGLADEMGAYTSPASKFGQLDADMLRACRLVIDTGVHAKHWTRQQMIDFLLKNYITGSRREIEAAVDRYISWPGQACAYKTGQLTILSLRGEAMKALGPKFDFKNFHDWILQLGPVPLYILKAEVHRQIALARAERSQ